MTRVLGVHGIGNYRYLRETGSPQNASSKLAEEWAASLRCALRDTEIDLSVAYYAHHLHRGAAQGDDTDPARLESGEQDLLIQWVELLQPTPAIAEGPRTARARQAADWLTRHHGGTARAFAPAFCREVHTYLSTPDAPRRLAARKTVADAIAEQRPDVIVAHSLGSVVAYETLWAHQEHDVDLLVTIGSPLAMPGVVLPRLWPGAARPPRVRRWLNFADIGDIVAIPRDGLSPYFAGVTKDVPVTIGTWDFHTAAGYLRCADVARAVADQVR
jgi:hypothetical protein